MARCLVCDHAVDDGSVFCSQACADVDAFSTLDEREIAFMRDDCGTELEELQQLASA